MKHAIQFFAALTLVLFVSMSANAQCTGKVAKVSDTKKCEAKKCDPAMCDLMVKAGLCTKEEAEKCKAKCAAKGTKVAAASVERVEGTTVSTTEATTPQPAKKASCAKTCAKTCSKKKVKSE